jgi:hypothetical protein
MGQRLFTLLEARNLQGNLLRTTQDFRDEFGRTLIPNTGVCRVVGLDAWDEYFATIAVQYDPHDVGDFPKLVQMNKTTYEENFEIVPAQTP